jgi:hypothetical protein
MVESDKKACLKVRRQLQDEFGFDPLGKETGIELPPPTNEEIAKAMEYLT